MIEVARFSSEVQRLSQGASCRAFQVEQPTVFGWLPLLVGARRALRSVRRSPNMLSNPAGGSTFKTQQKGPSARTVKPR